MKEMLVELRKERRSRKCPSALRNFALTLHFYSPSAYLYVRNVFSKNLPHPSSLRRWFVSVHYNPGISKEALNTVRRLVTKAETEDKKLYFNLTFDEMAIRDHIDWDGNKCHGYVDLGIYNNDLQDSKHNNNMIRASNALVFMLTCINQRFKIPIAYYLVRSLTGAEKQNILDNILHALYDFYIDVRSLTFDGASSNLSMVANFGVNLFQNESKAYFQNPYTKKNIYIILDACHMLKLVRNTLAENVITDDNDNVINWQYICKLVQFQEEQGLHAATKVRRRHIEFRNEKMKVFLAAQVLSFSISKALQFFEEDLKLPQFIGASGTSRFCLIFNDIFDLLNSKNPFNKTPSKQCIKNKNLDEIKEKVDLYTTYIKNLKINNINILNTKRKIPFYGFIINLNNVVLLAKDLFQDKQLSFLLTYKLSQDHLEMFFACIRRCGGLNNNPSARQFKSAYKKLLTHVNISVPLTANCIPIDDTLLLQEDINNNDILKVENLCLLDKDNDINNETIFFYHDYVSLSEVTFNNYLDDIISYISGFVVKTINKKINCDICKKNLITKKDEQPVSLLQNKKSYGNLISASKDVIRICKIAEKTVRQYKCNLNTPNILQQLNNTALHLLPMSDLFLDNEHMFNQDPLADHRNQLIRLILHKYFQIRLHHETSSLQDTKNRVRSKNTKLILFKGQ